ncbi:MAG: phage tail tape measure protein, partial [Thermodesulfobacteriota bacterium]
MKGIKYEEFQNIAKIAGQLGIKGVDNIKEFTRVVGMMGVATVLSTEEAAESFAQLANILHEPITNLEKMGSVINELSNNTTANAKDITELTKHMGGAAVNIGLTTDEIMGLAASIKDMGIRTEVGGTAMSQIFLKMLTDTDQFARASGKTLEEYTRMIKEEPIEAVKALLSQLSVLDKFGRAQAIGDLNLTGTKTAGTLLKLADGLEKVNKNLGIASKEYKTNTSLMNEYETAAQGLFAQATSINNALKIAADELGEDLLPLVKDALPEILQLIKALGWLAKAIIFPFIKVKEFALWLQGITMRPLLDRIFGTDEELKKRGATASQVAAKTLKDVERLEKQAFEAAKTKFKEREKLIADAAALEIEETKKVVAVKITKYKETLSELRSTLNQGEAAHRKYAKEIIAIEEKIKRAKMTGEEKVRALKQSLLAGEKLYRDKQLQAEEQISKAREALSKGDLKIAAEYAQTAQGIYASLGDKVVEDGKVVIEQTEAVEEATKGVETTVKLLTDIYGKEKQIAEEKNESIIAANETVKEQIEEISAKIKALEEKKTKHAIEIDDAAAKEAIEELKKATSSTHTVYVNEVQSRATGGMIYAARGGKLPGYGGGDTVPAMLEPGEFVVNKTAVRMFGADLFSQLNNLNAAAVFSRLGVQKLANGGPV